MSRVPMAAVLLALPLLGGCGDDGGVNGPNNPPLPSIAGTYSSSSLWLVQVLRFSDNFTTSFTCQGTLTIAQATSGALSGFAVVGAPCPPLSFPLAGAVRADGIITVNTGGPRPPQGPCPATLSVDYSGLASGNSLSVRGSTIVTCPEFGDHRFTYIVSARRNTF